MNEKRQLRVLTQSSIRAYRKCARMYSFYYHRLVRPVATSEALMYGTLWHEVRAAWWRAPSALRLADALGVLNNMNLDDAFQEARLFAMLVGYHNRWCAIVDSYEILGVEKQFSIDLVNPRTDRSSRTYKIDGVFDAVVRDDGRIWVVEEKTASGDLSPESPYWRRLEIDPQCSIYYHAVKSVFGEEPAGIKYFVNVKPGLKPLQATPIEARKYTKATSKEPSRLYANQREDDETVGEYKDRLFEKIAEKAHEYYVQADVPRLESDIYESNIDVWDTARAILDSENSNIWLRNPDNCVHPFGSVCSYLPVCANRGTIEDPTLYRKAEKAHEELNVATVTD